MRFAILGADAETLALADAAQAAGHAISWREPAGAPASDISWEALFDDATADAVIVGAGDADLRARQIQELVKQGRPLLAVHPVVPSVISYFEIDMARTESGAVLQHYNPLVESQLVDHVAGQIPAGHPTLGAVEQITATRLLADRGRQRVLWHFARDVQLLARLAGRLDRIGAHAAAGGEDAAYASLGVQLSGPMAAPIRWAVEPPAGQPELRVAIVCQRGRATLVFDADDRCAELLIQSAAGESRFTATGAPPPTRALAHFAAAVGANDGAASTWPAALDSMELADSIEISLRRGRMIDVHHRELTEQLAFKGMMSAVGCGVLVLLVPLALVVGWLAGLLNIPLSDYWPHALLALLAAFLGLQFLPKLFPAKSGPTATKPHSAAGESPFTATGAPPSDDAM